MEDEWLGAELDVGSVAFALDIEASAEFGWEVEVLLVWAHARIWLGCRLVTGQAESLILEARAVGWHGAADLHGHADAVGAARVLRAHVESVARGSRKSGRTRALELSRRQVSAGASILARVSLAQSGHLAVDGRVALVQSEVVDGMVRALHDD